VALSGTAVWQIDRRSPQILYAALSRTLELSISDVFFLDPSGPAIRAISDAITSVVVFGSIRLDDRKAVKALTRCLGALKKSAILDLSDLVLWGGEGGEPESYAPFWEAFLSSLPGGRFTCLRLDEMPVGITGIAILGESGLVASIRHLSLARCLLGPRGAHALAKWDGAPDLKQLDLAANQINMSAARALLRGPLAGGLSALSLASNPIREPFLEGIRAHGNRLNLRSLDLSATSLGSATFLALATEESTSRLVDVRMAT
jgi:hypothetical protein